MKFSGASLKESLQSVLPIFAIVLLICIVLGVLITIAEPDLQVLAEQVPSVPNMTLILFVAGGVGLFLAISLLRTRFNIPLSRLLPVCYILVFVLAIFVPVDFIPTAFDSGGVTTGPVTVPFIMTLGAGMASLGKGKNSQENSFGLVSLCSIGPILSVLILSICFKPAPETTQTTIEVAETTAEAFRARQVDAPALEQFGQPDAQEEKEIITIMAPVTVSTQIMEDVNREFGMNTEAQGMVCALPVVKTFKL